MALRPRVLLLTCLAAGCESFGAPDAGSELPEAALDIPDARGAVDLETDAEGSPPNGSAPQAADGGKPDGAMHDLGVLSEQWRSYGHDLSNTRANPHETRIGVDNIGTLKLKWSWDTTAVTSTPVYYEGKLYFGDWQAYVVALDAETGEEVWRVPDPTSALGLQISGSVTATEDAIYVGAQDAYLHRVNRATGAFEWSVRLDDAETAHVYGSPALIDDLVIAGVGAWQNINPIGFVFELKPFRGSIHARDAKTGAARWNVTLTEGTGVGVCASAAIDPARRRLFIGSGNNYDDGSDSPYADSLIALDVASGERAWHRQFTQGDQWGLTKPDGPDHDLLASPLLLSAGGVEAVGAGDKGGTFRVFDRDGALIWQKQLTPGGHHGGVMGSAAYHNGVIYVCSGDFSTDQTIGWANDAPPESLVLALNAADGTQRWATHIESGCYGALTYANGVVYLPSVDGLLRAFDAANGREIWSQALGASSAGGVSVVNGTLFVSYGWDWALPGGAGGVKAFAVP